MRQRESKKKKIELEKQPDYRKNSSSLRIEGRGMSYSIGKCLGKRFLPPELKNFQERIQSPPIRAEPKVKNLYGGAENFENEEFSFGHYLMTTIFFETARSPALSW